jgi:hypothetical protein
MSGALISQCGNLIIIKNDERGFVSGRIRTKLYNGVVYFCKDSHLSA